MKKTKFSPTKASRVLIQSLHSDGLSMVGSSYSFDGHVFDYDKPCIHVGGAAKIKQALKAAYQAGLKEGKK